MKKIFEKYREIIMYLIFGVLTTVVGFAVYYIITKALVSQMHDEKGNPSYTLVLLAEIVQWICAVLFAYFTNKKFVFESTAKSKKERLSQFFQFIGSRLFSIVIETVIVLGGTYLIGLTSYKTIYMITPDIIAKLVAAVVVVITNYVLSKLVVFRKK